MASQSQRAAHRNPSDTLCTRSPQVFVHDWCSTSGREPASVRRHQPTSSTSSAHTRDAAGRPRRQEISGMVQTWVRSLWTVSRASQRPRGACEEGSARPFPPEAILDHGEDVRRAVVTPTTPTEQRVADPARTCSTGVMTTALLREHLRTGISSATPVPGRSAGPRRERGAGRGRPFPCIGSTGEEPTGCCAALLESGADAGSRRHGPHRRLGRGRWMLRPSQPVVATPPGPGDPARRWASDPAAKWRPSAATGGDASRWRCRLPHPARGRC